MKPLERGFWSESLWKMNWFAIRSPVFESATATTPKSGTLPFSSWNVYLPWYFLLSSQDHYF